MVRSKSCRRTPTVTGIFICVGLGLLLALLLTWHCQVNGKNNKVIAQTLVFIDCVQNVNVGINYDTS